MLVNGPHDMGGMQCFGRVPIEADEPLFHEPWEARALALTLAMAGWRQWTLDRSRHAREQIPPSDYLRYSYYERWIAALEALMIEANMVTPEEIRSGRPADDAGQNTPPLSGGEVAEMLARGSPTSRRIESPQAFAVGDAVRTVNRHPAGHTRLPLYARGCSGLIVMHHGAHVLPDTNAHGLGEAPHHLYAVRFAARSLWGPDASPVDTVTLDLWECYLEHP